MKKDEKREENSEESTTRKLTLRDGLRRQRGDLLTQFLRSPKVRKEALSPPFRVVPEVPWSIPVTNHLHFASKSYRKKKKKGKKKLTGKIAPSITIMHTDLTPGDKVFIINNKK